MDNNCKYLIHWESIEKIEDIVLLLKAMGFDIVPTTENARLEFAISPDNKDFQKIMHLLNLDTPIKINNEYGE